MSANDIAVVGMAGRFPGAPDLARFWANVRNGVESIVPLSDEELLAAGVTPEELGDPDYVKVCPVLDGIDRFDARFFGFSPRDAAVMDPAHRLFLEVAWEALEHAGRTGLAEDGPVGVFAGSGAPYYLMDHVRRDAALMRSMGEFLVRHTNNDMNFLAPRVSYEMDLRGPSVNVQTACSSALVAVHMACESIRRGECRMALAGGSTVLIPDRRGYLYQEGEIMSPDGHCRPFDEKSAGTVFGSGSGCVVLKPLEAALDDGDFVHAVVKGSAINNDGALRVGFLAPGIEGQSAAVAAALDAAGVDAGSITYIEAHGTGTSVGDPIEVEALNQAFRPRTDRRRFCALASVKSNLGHLGEAAGIASFIKAVLALKHREIPPSLGFEVPSPRIDFDDSPFFVNDRLRPWQAEGPLRCGVTALGAGGTNCHVILEEGPPPLDSEGARDTHILVLSARSGESLDRARERLASALESDASLALADAAWTLAVGRRALPERCVVVGRDRSDLVRALRGESDTAALTGVADDAARSVVFMFPGGGAQYPRMGAELYETEAAYREAADACFRIVDPVLGRSLASLVFCAPDEVPAAARELERPSRTLPALFTTEYALARLFQAWGVEPVALLGHSMGEYVAACLSGVMTLEDALRLVMLRGRLFEAVERGGMLSVPLPEEDLRALMPEGLSVAAVNAPDLCVASGPVAAIEALERTLAARDVDSTRVRIDVAAHSSMLDPVLDEFRQLCRTIDLKPPRIPFPSNVTGDWITPAEAVDPDYWVRHLRATVRFADCLTTLADDDRVLLEVGPGRTLATLARAQETPVRHAYNSMRHPEQATGDMQTALGVMGRLWLAGVPTDWHAVFDGQILNRIPLPTYAWDHERHWIEAPPAGAPVAPAPPDGHRRDRVADWFERPTWRRTLPPTPLADGDGSVLLFAREGGFAEAVGARLAAAGRRVVTVRPGAAFERCGDVVTVRTSATEDYEELLRSLAADGGLPSSVVHGWGVADDPASASLDAILETGFHGLLALGRALGAEDPDAAFTLDVLTAGLEQVGGEAGIDPAQALVLGPARVMPREFPGVRCRSIDVVVPADGARRRVLAASVAAEVAREVSDDTVAYRGRDRFVSELEPVRLDASDAALRDGGVYLVTGGLGGLGYTLAEHLARERRARLVLVGRSATPERARPRVEALEALGAEVEVVRADVAVPEQIRSAVARALERFGALHGVFHTAGVLGDSLMPLKTRHDAERVLAPKVQGTLALDAALDELAPDVELFVLFSSISSRAGLAGQADYTAANAFLDAFAQERSLRAPGRTVAVNWSAWRDVGMAADIASGAGSGGASDEVVHPVLGRRVWGGPEADLFAAELSVDADWVVGEHRIRGGRSLMPGTGFVELVRAALEARPEGRSVEIRDLAFLSTFVLPEEGARELRVHITRNGGGPSTVAVAGRVEGADGIEAWQEHATAQARYADDAPPAALDLVSIGARCTVREEVFAPDQESVHMDFGGRWKNLRSIRFGQGEALVSLELPDAYAPELDVYRLHPALLDMATGRCEALVPGFDPARDFYVPLSYTRVRMFAPLTPRIFSHVRVAPSEFDPREFLVFDVTITDPAGRVLVEVEEFVMTRVADADDLQGPPRGSQRRARASYEAPPAPAVLPAMVRLLEGAIAPAEGMEALDRIVAGPAVSQVYVTPMHASTLIERLREPPAPPAPMAEAAGAEALLRLDDVEAAMVTHEAVARCVAVQRRNRPGDLKVVAYVVFTPGEDATVSDLRRFARKELPEDRVPSTFIELDELPAADGGDVDTAALPDPFGVADDVVAPRTPTEVLIADIWKEVLGVARVSVRDNFFDAGGHSLLAMRVVVKITRATGVRLNQSAMVLQTLEQMAAECDRQLSEKAAPAPDEAAPSGGLGARLFNTLRGE